MESRRDEALDLLCDEFATFYETVKALRELTQTVHPQAVTLDENPRWRTVLARQLELIASEKRDDFLATMEATMPFVSLVLHGSISTRRRLSDDRTAPHDTEVDWTEIVPMDLVPVERREEMEQSLETSDETRGVADFKMTQSEDGRIRIDFADPALRRHFWAVIDELEKAALTPSRAALLMRSVLTMAVSSFEVLVSSTYQAHLICNPGAIENQDTKMFSLQELFAFESVQDAIEETIFQQCDQFSRKGVRAWVAWFKGRPLTIDLESLALDWSKTEEVFERRNIVVHNASRVTRQYLKNVDRSLTTDLEEGSIVDVDPEYIAEALSRLCTLGLLLVLQVRTRLFKRGDREGLSEWISDQQFDLILDEEFAAVEQVAKATSGLDLIQTSAQLLRVNGWIARIRLHGLESCRGEIESWDTSASAAEYKAAKQILLQNDERATELVEECLSDGTFTIANLAEWPLFHWMREAGLLGELITGMSEESLEEQTATMNG